MDKEKTLEQKVAENTRHIKENTREIKNESKMIHVLYGIVIGLLVIIAGLSYYIGGKVNSVQSYDNKGLKIQIIDDKRCTDCQTDAIVTSLKSLPILAGAKFETLDFSDSDMKEFLKENEIKTLPAVILSKDTIVDPAGQITQFIKKLPNGQGMLEIGSKFDPFSEICDNKIDDTGDGNIDCADSTCASKTECRTEEKAKLEVFLMGYCPFGEIAAKAIPSILETFKDEVTLDFHYIATKTGDGYSASDFNSLHGVTEAEENIRQLCIKKEYGVKTLVNYMQKRYQNADNYGKVTDDVSLAYEAAGIQGDKINSCVTSGEGGKLLAADIKIAEGLGIGASPTWLANNRYQFG